MLPGVTRTGVFRIRSDLVLPTSNAGGINTELHLSVVASCVQRATHGFDLVAAVSNKQAPAIYSV